MQAQQLLEDLFIAYYEARRNKRNTINQLHFEIEYERNLIELRNEILNRTYKPRPSIAFIIRDPVPREIFAADFRDRVVHHLIFNYINPVLEQQFIADSYSCRKGKGTHYGIQRVAGFVQSCSDHYTKNYYILKLDIQGYFMSINKHLLWKKLMSMLEREILPYAWNTIVLYLLEKTIWNDPRKDCIIKSKAIEWRDLPNTKSLFHAAPDCGLPIGNLTSQLFSNVYLHDFDLFVKRELGVEHYGRYVDDFILLHTNKEFLKVLQKNMTDYLQAQSGLIVHPKKIYLQHYTKGVAFLGAYIKPHRIYIGNRTKRRFLRAVRKTDTALSVEKTEGIPSSLHNVRATLNSYLGIMQHYSTYNIRKRALLGSSHLFFRYGYLNGGLRKYVLIKKRL